MSARNGFVDQAYPSRREQVADILDALGRALPFSFTLGGNDRADRLHDGAETLRWCDQWEDPFSHRR